MHTCTPYLLWWRWWLHWWFKLLWDPISTFCLNVGHDITVHTALMWYELLLYLVAHAGGADIPEGEAMAALLRRTMYLASRHKDRKVTSAAGTAFAYLLRSSLNKQGTFAVQPSLSRFPFACSNRTALTSSRYQATWFAAQTCMLGRGWQGKVDMQQSSRATLLHVPQYLSQSRAAIVTATAVEISNRYQFTSVWYSTPQARTILTLTVTVKALNVTMGDVMMTRYTFKYRHKSCVPNLEFMC